MTHGLETQAPGPENQGMAKATAGLAILEALGEGMASGDGLSVFKGNDKRCMKPVASGWLTNNCCKESVKDDGDNLIAKCNQEELDLAAARRAKRTHYIGTYCDKSFLGSCLAKKQTYCVFESMLSRLIQQQGRAQLAALQASGYAGAQYGNLAFTYYNSVMDSGAWSPAVSVSGNKVAAFKWPGYCSDVELMTQAYNRAADTRDDTIIICPATPETYTASCATNDCGTLPIDPRSSSDTWDIQVLDPLSQASSSISKYVAATGGCNPTTEACDYKLTAWPAGEGGKALIRIDLNWPLYMPAGSVPTVQQIGNYVFRLHSLPGLSGPVPATVPMDFGEGTAPVSLPTNIKAEDNYAIKPDVYIYGSCDARTLQCNYRVTAKANVEGMPWGTPKAPQCGGFNLAQLSVLDFGKMNLDEWASTLGTKAISQPDLVDKSASGTQDFYDAYNSNSYQQAENPSAVRIARAHPSEGVAPFTTTLTVTSNWPTAYQEASLNTNPVTSVSVDWGDNSGPPTQLVKGANGAYVGTHVYQKQANPSVPGEYMDVTHVIKLTMQTLSSGTQTSTFDIINYAHTPQVSPGGGGVAETGSIYQQGIAPGGAIGSGAGL
jgi:hypothetical protein